jgi:hypothetical protein
MANFSKVQFLTVATLLGGDVLLCLRITNFSSMLQLRDSKREDVQD